MTEQTGNNFSPFLFAIITSKNKMEDWGVMPIIVFSAIFVVGYVVIWAIIYSITKKNTEKLNEMLKQKQQNP